MKDFNLHKYLRDNPLTEEQSKKTINESFENFGGYIDLKPLSEANPLSKNEFDSEDVYALDFNTNQDPSGWDKHSIEKKDGGEDQLNKWMMDIDRYSMPYKDWSVSWEYPGIIVWAHADIPDAVVIATPGWSGNGTPVEFQSDKGSSQMLKVLDQDVFPDFKSYVRAIKPYLDMVEDANSEATAGTMSDNSEFQEVHESMEDEKLSRFPGKTEFPSFGNPLDGFPTEYKELLKKLQRSNDANERTELINMMNIIRKKLKLTPLSNILNKKNATKGGYAGTPYDSSEDMAVDMVKKGIREGGINTPRVDYLNPMGDEDDDYEEQNPMDRMKGLVNQNHLKMFVTGARGMMGDLLDDGFEPDEIYEFLMDIFKKID